MLRGPLCRACSHLPWQDAGEWGGGEGEEEGEGESLSLCMFAWSTLLPPLCTRLLKDEV